MTPKILVADAIEQADNHKVRQAASAGTKEIR